MTWNRLLRDRTVDELLARAGFGGPEDRLRTSDASPLFAKVARREPVVRFAFDGEGGVCGAVARAVWDPLLGGLATPAPFVDQAGEYWAEFVGALVTREEFLFDGALRLWARELVRSAHQHARPSHEIEMDPPTKRALMHRIGERYVERTGFGADAFGTERERELFAAETYGELEEALVAYLKTDVEERAGGAS